MNEPLKEDNREYHINKPFLTRLVHTKLIVKKIQNELVWDISETCARYFAKLNAKYGIYPSNIIPQMYFSENYTEEQEDKTLGILRSLLIRGENYGKLFLDLIHSILEDYEQVSQFSRSMHILTKTGVSEDIISKIENSLKNFVIAFVILCDDNVQDYETAVNHFEESWYEIRDVTIFSEKLYEFNSEEVASNQEKLEVLKEYSCDF